MLHWPLIPEQIRHEGPQAVTKRSFDQKTQRTIPGPYRRPLSAPVGTCPGLTPLQHFAVAAFDLSLIEYLYVHAGVIADDLRKVGDRPFLGPTRRIP